MQSSMPLKEKFNVIHSSLEMTGTVYHEGPHEMCHMQAQGSREKERELGLCPHCWVSRKKRDVPYWAGSENTHSMVCGCKVPWLAGKMETSLAVSLAL